MWNNTVLGFPARCYVQSRNPVLRVGLLGFVLASGFGFAEPPVEIPETAFGKTVREIRFEGLNRTREGNVLRELASQVGEPYTRRSAAADPERLDRLRIFSSYDIKVIEETDSVILEIRVKETFRFLPILSIDVSDETGVSVGPGFKAINLAGKQMFFSTAARFGGATDLETILRNPWFAGNHLSYQADFRYVDRFNELDKFEEQSAEFGFELGSYIGNSGRIGTRFKFVSLRSDMDGITLSETNHDKIPRLGFYLGYDDRDFWSDTRDGWWNEVEVSKSGGFLGGDGDFWTVNFDVRKYQRMATRHSIALFSLTTLQSGMVGVDIPIHQDFHLGGTNTIRGWSLDSSRGRNQFINTAEYRYSLLKPRSLSFKGLTLFFGIHLAVFGDLGIAWNENHEFNTENFIGGYGFGIRFLVPFVDMIRVDFALGEPGRGLRSYVAIEPKPVKQRKRIR